MMGRYPSPDGIAVYFVDITEQKKIQEKLFIDEQNLRAIINNTKDIIWSIDRDMNIISANQAFWDRVELITGKGLNEVGQDDFDQLRYNSWKEYFDRAFSGESFNIIWTETTQNGIIYEDVSFNPIFDQDSRTIGVSCFSRDVTQQRIHIDMIEKQNQRLKDIAWIQSHQVRGPVATILGLVELFNIENPYDPINAALFRNVKVAAVDLDGVIRKIIAHTIA